MAGRDLAETILQLLYPPRCIFCDAVLGIGEKCAKCAETAKALKLTGQRRIAAGARHAADISKRKQEDPAQGKAVGSLDAVVVSFVYTGAAAKTVARYKFNARPDLYRSMARYMADDVAELLDARAIDLVVDVPSYRDKTEHAKLLAKGVARLLSRPYGKNLLVKTRKTPKQHEQTYAMRQGNLRGAFGVAKGGDVAGKTVLICDDVLTSGHTLNACAAALRAAGAAAVYGCVFSGTRASSQSPLCSVLP